MGLHKILDRPKIMFKKKAFIIILTLVMLLTVTSNAFALYKTASGTWTYKFTTSDYVVFYPSFDFFCKDYYTYVIATKKYDIFEHWNDGTINDDDYFSLFFEQVMTNTSKYYSRAKSTDSFSQVGIIYSYEWVAPEDILVPPEDTYYPGYNKTKSFSTNAVTSCSKITWSWWVYIDEGDYGATGNFSKSKDVIF